MKKIYILYIDVSVSASSLLFVCQDALQQLAPCIFRNPIDFDIRCPFGDQIHPEARKFYENAGGKNINWFLENTGCTGFFLRQIVASSCKFEGQSWWQWTSQRLFPRLWVVWWNPGLYKPFNRTRSRSIRLTVWTHEIKTWKKQYGKCSSKPTSAQGGQVGPTGLLGRPPQEF